MNRGGRQQGSKVSNIVRTAAGRLLKPARRIIRRTYRLLGYDISRWPPLLDELPGHLAGLLPRLGVNCVIDVGAHWGEYGTQLRALGYEGRIVSFEPVGASAERLRERAKDDSSWMVLQVALGRSSESRLMNVPGHSDLASFLEPDEFVLTHFPDSAIQSREEVQVRRLDELFDECTAGIAEPRVYVKMDTQGWDLEVFAGAAERLDRIVALQSELSVKAINQGMPIYLEALTEYHRMGFELTGLFPISRDERSRIIEFDAVMVRR